MHSALRSKRLHQQTCTSAGRILSAAAHGRIPWRVQMGTTKLFGAASVCNAMRTMLAGFAPKRAQQCRRQVTAPGEHPRRATTATTVEQETIRLKTD